MSARPSAEYEALRRVWLALPEGVPLSEAEVDEGIRRAARLPEWDGAGAAARRGMLEAAGALRRVRDAENPRVFQFLRGPFPEAVDARPGSAAFNAELEARHRFEEERRAREKRLAEEARAVIDAPLIAAQQWELRRQVRQIVEELLAARGLAGPAVAGEQDQSTRGPSSGLERGVK